MAYTHFLVADVVPYISRHLVSSHGPGAQWRRGPEMGSLPSRSLQLAGGRAHARNRSRRRCDKTRLRIKGTDIPRGRGRTPFKVRHHSLCPFPWETFLCVGSHLAPLLKGTNVAKTPFREKFVLWESERMKPWAARRPPTLAGLRRPPPGHIPPAFALQRTLRASALGFVSASCVITEDVPDMFKIGREGGRRSRKKPCSFSVAV